MFSKTMKRFGEALVTALFFALVLFSAVAPQQARSQSLPDYVENNVTDFVLRAQTWTIPSALYWGLSSTACSDSSTGTELSGGSYARVSFTRSLANWSGTQSAGSTTASTGTGGQSSNNVAFNYPTPTAGQGTASHFFLIDSASGAGNLYLCQALTTSKTINTGDTVSFPVGAITVTFQ